MTSTHTPTAANNNNHQIEKKRVLCMVELPVGDRDKPVLKAACESLFQLGRAGSGHECRELRERQRERKKVSLHLFSNNSCFFFFFVVSSSFEAREREKERDNLTLQSFLFPLDRNQSLTCVASSCVFLGFFVCRSLIHSFFFGFFLVFLLLSFRPQLWLWVDDAPGGPDRGAAPPFADWISCRGRS